jgi:hypothetical protein
MNPDARVTPLCPHELTRGKRLHDLATEFVKVQTAMRVQNYLSHMVSQIPSSESPLNALLTRENAEAVNEQTAATIGQVNVYIADLEARIHR